MDGDIDHHFFAVDQCRQLRFHPASLSHSGLSYVCAIESTLIPLRRGKKNPTHSSSKSSTVMLCGSPRISRSLRALVAKNTSDLLITPVAMTGSGTAMSWCPRAKRSAMRGSVVHDRPPAMREREAPR